MRAGAASLLAALAVVAAGCGGGGGGGENALPGAAEVVPASAPVLISINTEFDSRQWENALALVPKFPSLPGLLRRSGRETGLDFERDLKPALGPEVDVVFLDFANEGNDVVGLTQPKNKAKLLAALKKRDAADDSGSKTYTEDVNGWTVVADARSKIDAFRSAAAGDKLADDDGFKDAMSRLDEKAGVRAYVAGPPVQRALDRALEQGGAAPNLTRDLARMESLSAAGLVERAGVRVEAALATDPSAKPKTYTPTLAATLPAGAYLYLSTANLADPTRTILKLVDRSNPGTKQKVDQFLGVIGFDLKGDVYPLLSGEQALAIYPARPIPKIVFAAKVPNPGRAQELVARVVQLLKISGELAVESFDVGGTTVDGLSQPGTSVHVYVAVAGDKLLITSARDTLPTLIQGSGEALADDPLYRRARSDAKTPAKVAGLAYADLTHGLPFVFDLAEANGSSVPPEARANTGALSHALLHARQDGNRFLLSGFAAIK